MVQAHNSLPPQLRLPAEIEALLDDWLLEAQISASLRQAKDNATVARRFLAEMEIAELSGIDARSVRVFLVEQKRAGRSAKTLRNYRSSLSVFCDYLRERGILRENPCKTIRLPRGDQRLPVYLDKQDYQVALEVARAHGIFAEVALGLLTGLRLGEMRKLEWVHLDMERRQLRVVCGKGRKDRVVSLNERAVAVLGDQRKVTGHFDFVFPTRQVWGAGMHWKWLNKPRSAWWWCNAMKPLQEAIPKYQLLKKGTVGRAYHMFRHTFASRAAQSGVTIFKIGSWLGHSDVRTTQIYAHLAPGYDEDIEKV